MNIKPKRSEAANGESHKLVYLLTAHVVFMSHLAVSLIPKLDLEKLCCCCVPSDRSHILYQGGFATSNWTL